MSFIRADEIGHPGPDFEDVHTSIAKVIDYAKMLGLHGVMILSPRCPECGHLHAFSMQTDIMANIDAEGSEVAGLLRHFADAAERTRPTQIEPPGASN